MVANIQAPVWWHSTSIHHTGHKVNRIITIFWCYSLFRNMQAIEWQNFALWDVEYIRYWYFFILPNYIFILLNLKDLYYIYWFPWYLSLSLKKSGRRLLADSIKPPYERRTILLTWIKFNPTCISNHIHYNMWGEITYPFPNFNGATFEVWYGWVSSAHILQWL